MDTASKSQEKLLFYSDKYNKCFMIDDLNETNFDINKNLTVNGVFDKVHSKINRDNAQKYSELLFDVLKETHESISVNVDQNLTKYLNISQVFSESKGYLSSNDNTIRDLRKKVFSIQKIYTTRLNDIINIQNE